MRGKGFQRYCSRKIKVCCCLFAQSCLTVCEHDCRLPWSLAHCCTSYCNSCRVPGFAPCLPHSLLGTSSPYLLEAEVQRPVTLPFLHSCHLVLVPQSCLPLCDPMNCSLPGSSVHGTLQVRILEWVAIFSSKYIQENQGLFRQDILLIMRQSSKRKRQTAIITDVTTRDGNKNNLVQSSN